MLILLQNGEYDLIWINRIYLLFMAVIYGTIGVWAILDPLLGALELGYPSFLEAVGLSVTSQIGYSEIAGIYGGLNLCIGIMCLVGIFKENIGIFFNQVNNFYCRINCIGQSYFFNAANHSRIL